MKWRGWSMVTSAACALAATACGPTTADGEGGAASSSSTTDASGETASATSASPESSGEGTDSGDETSSVPACSEPSTPDISFEVMGVEQTGSFVFQSSCTVDDVQYGDVVDELSLECRPRGTDTVAVRIAFTNAAVLLPTSLVVGADVDVAFIGAAEYGDRWLTLRHPEGRLLLGISAAASTTIPVDGAPSDVFAPLQVTPIGDRCAPGPGSCYALGEPAVLQFALDDASLELEPFQAGSVGDFTVHAGDSWLSDATSVYSCDGPSDNRVRFIVGVP